MLKEAWNAASEYGDTGVHRVRSMFMFCMGYLCARAMVCFHWLKGDLDAWLDNLETEDDKRG